MINMPSKIPESDLARLVKILEMTSSSNDAEVLVSARKAQALLGKYTINYNDIFTSIKDRAPRKSSMIYALENKIHRLKKEIDSLKNEVKSSKSTTSLSDYFGPLEGLKTFLINNFSLRNYERTLLEDITEIHPKSKEEYMILICAKHHGVSYTPAY